MGRDEGTIVSRLTGVEKRRYDRAIKRAVGAWSKNQRRAAAQARKYLADALKAHEELVEGERGHVLDELKTALRGIKHMLDDIESGKDGDLP